MSGPLDGILVLALEQAVAAPYCTSRLADAGARVIKIERPEGDFARDYDHSVGALSSYFVWLNRGKQSLVADIKSPSDGALLLAILERTDVFIQNLAPGAAARAGFGSDTLRARYPSLITVDIAGYGPESTYSTRKAYDLLVQAESGLASVTGHGTEPGRVGVSVCDIACGMSAHAAVLEALLERSRTGRGTGLKLSLFDSIADWMSVPLLQFEATGRAPRPAGLMHPSICPYGVFKSADGQSVVIAVQNEREWAGFCSGALRDPALVNRPGFETNVVRVANRASVDSHIAAVFNGLTMVEIRARLSAAGIAYADVNGLDAFSRHPALRREPVRTPHGIARIARSPIVRSGGTAPFGPVPAIGEHSEAIRTEFAYSASGLPQA